MSSPKRYYRHSSPGRDGRSTMAMTESTRAIAHDLNNQLAVIMNYSSFVLDDVDDPERMHEDVAEIRNAAERARDLTQQLLTTGRRETVEP
jgi:signal transduction histidine kinase